MRRVRQLRVEIRRWLDAELFEKHKGAACNVHQYFADAAGGRVRPPFIIGCRKGIGELDELTLGNVPFPEELASKTDDPLRHWNHVNSQQVTFPDDRSRQGLKTSG
jgi:hypothetical protein